MITCGRTQLFTNRTISIVNIRDDGYLYNSRKHSKRQSFLLGDCCRVMHVILHEPCSTGKLQYLYLCIRFMFSHRIRIRLLLFVLPNIPSIRSASHMICNSLFQCAAKRSIWVRLRSINYRITMHICIPFFFCFLFFLCHQRLKPSKSIFEKKHIERQLRKRKKSTKQSKPK